MKKLFSRCNCCGKYFTPTEENKKFCSEECSKNYLRCSVCGNYYIIDDFLDKENLICDEICQKRLKLKKLKMPDKIDFNKLV